nr:uncharacterized protein LOC128700347 [Cherax quadricarinatus]XP_053649443.1 uncharacterized protein LOC128700347 [Cherax quadricarinatus]XP_053649444.1 uncharacterized protein LOC128700347 [Cherax quadricarinatus]XP_053649445.1 uncharacterized protein LOC128700347 [Cherax quadricarinatus]
MKQFGYLILMAALLVLFFGSGTAKGRFPFEQCVNKTAMKAKMCAELNLSTTECADKKPLIKNCTKAFKKENFSTFVGCVNDKISTNLATSVTSEELESAITAAIEKNKETVCAQVPAVMTCFKDATNMPQKISECINQPTK